MKGFMQLMEMDFEVQALSLLCRHVAPEIITLATLTPHHTKVTKVNTVSKPRCGQDGIVWSDARPGKKEMEPAERERAGRGQRKARTKLANQCSREIFRSDVEDTCDSHSTERQRLSGRNTNRRPESERESERERDRETPTEEQQTSEPRRVKEKERCKQSEEGKEE